MGLRLKVRKGSLYLDIGFRNGDDLGQNLLNVKVINLIPLVLRLVEDLAREKKSFTTTPRFPIRSPNCKFHICSDCISFFCACFAKCVDHLHLFLLRLFRKMHGSLASLSSALVSQNAWVTCISFFCACFAKCMDHGLQHWKQTKRG